MVEHVMTASESELEIKRRNEHRKRSNQILGMEIEDDWTSSPTDIELAIARHFRDSFMEKKNVSSS